MAHRDDTRRRRRRERQRKRDGGADRARAGLRPARDRGQRRVQSPHTIVFLSTDARLVREPRGRCASSSTSPFRDRIIAVVNLEAIAGAGPPRLEIAGRAAALTEPEADRNRRRAASRSRAAGRPSIASFFGQLIDLGFPFTLDEQGVRSPRGLPAITLTTAGDRPPPAFGDTPGRLDSARLAQLGPRGAGARSARSTRGSRSRRGRRATSGSATAIVRGWTIELVLVALLVPFIVAIVDLFALCRRHGVGFKPALLALRSRLAFWLFVGIVFTCFRLLGAWPAGPPQPPNPATAAAGDWPVVALAGFLVVLACGWLVTRPRLAVRRRVTAEEQLVGSHRRARRARRSSACSSSPPTRSRSSSSCRRSTCGSGCPRSASPDRPCASPCSSRASPARRSSSARSPGASASGSTRPGTCSARRGRLHRHARRSDRARRRRCCAASSRAAAAGRYAPYPTVGERGPRGPVRELVRTVVLARARTASRRRAAAPVAGRLRAEV